MRFHLTRFAVATRFTLIEHGRNRFAMVLVILFVPVWASLAYLAMPDTPTRMRLRATGEALAPHGNELTAISGALNAVTLITGFMMFAATFSGSGFDRRLAMAGYPRAHLVLAKVTALALVSAAVAAYATAVICLAWTPASLCCSPPPCSAPDSLTALWESSSGPCCAGKSRGCSPS